MNTAIVVGNPKPRSRTFRAAWLIIEKLTGREPDLAIDVIDLAPGLLDSDNPMVAQAVGRVQESRLVVFASPTYKATYTGLLKLFLDRFPAGSLTGVVSIPLMVGGDWRHSLAPETFLKPVINELGASSPTRGLFLLDSDADCDWSNSGHLDSWLEGARIQVPRLPPVPGVA